MNSTIREIAKTILTPAIVAGWLVGSFAAAYVGAFGTAEFTGGVQLYSYWLFVIGISIVIAKWNEHFFGPGKDWKSFMVQSLKAALGFSLLFGTFLMAIHKVFQHHEHEGFFHHYDLYFFLYVIFVGASVIRMNFRPWLTSAGEPSIAFFKRMDRSLGTSLMRLSVQDHYVEVHTSKGKELILMRFADAVDELDGFGGLQVHRSHWVARNAIIKVKRDGRKNQVVLSNGDEIPVSKNYLDDVLALDL